MANLTKSYETVFVLSNKLTEEATAELVKKFTDLIAANGTIDSIDEWGKRRLAYEIDYEQEGYYVLVNFTAPHEFPAELDRIYKITEGVIRSLNWEGNDLLIGNVCVGTGVGSYDFYCGRPCSTNDLHGVGAFLLMCTELQSVLTA